MASTKQQIEAPVTAQEIENTVVHQDASLAVRRYFTIPGREPFDEIEWETRDAFIPGKDKPVFEQKDVEFPKFWSQTATNIVAQKYFRGRMTSPERERSVRQMIGRVVDTISAWGRKDGYFATEEEAETFEAELKAILVNQLASFNSPVWFNVGFEERPQCSACFILSIEDSMDAILDWIRREGVIFRGGSGSGVNLSKLRSSKERLVGGGTASGPVSFMKAADASAGVIKSGGKTRRAAKMVVLNVDHPDIMEFISCKTEEERKARALIAAGYDSSLDGAAYGSVAFQNANNSVRVTDAFMNAVVSDGDWQTRFVRTGEVSETFRARELMRSISENAHACGDPGLQFDTTINDWHTCPASGRINASNPCSEYMHLDNSACNLSSLNLMKFVGASGDFDVDAFKHAVDVMITAQDIIVDNSSYPTPEIDKNAHAFRELGLGYANLGALLMSLGLPYDSESGRQYAAAVTALMCGEAYLQSARIAGEMGPYSGYAPNREAMQRVIGKHRSAAHKIDPALVPLDLLSEARRVWDDAFTLGEKQGFRNSQATVLAPTGTIAFMMDCDTTGIEPDIALVKYKKLVGGGMLKIVNMTIRRALARLGYESKQIQDILEYVEEQETIEGAPHLRDDDLAVFDCAFKPQRGARSIHYLGHIRMMGAAQPFISGAISKTVNMPADATIDDVTEAYLEAWRDGLKAIAIYRDGCKQTQPLNTGKASTEVAKATAVEARPIRRRLQNDCKSERHKFDIAGHEGYIHVGFYEDGTPGEIFIKMAKEGSTISGLMDTIATLTSMSLQYGVPLEVLVNKFAHVRFEPSGFTKNPEIPMAKSLTDYIFRFLGARYLSAEQRIEVGLADYVTAEARVEREPQEIAAAPRASVVSFSPQADAPSCSDCGAIMVRNGSCYKCLNCGSTSGCS
jgi:ribonucleoside-diphosphate reductase alpha chain